MATFSTLAAIKAKVLRNAAWRSRWMTWFETGAGRNPNFVQTVFSTCGGTCANVPMAPESFPTATSSPAAINRLRWRVNSSYQIAIFSPKEMGSPCIPWDRPTMTVSLCLRACVWNTSNAASRSSRMISRASTNWRASPVSNTSEEVNPACKCRALVPACSAIDSKKAMTSCLVTRSISAIRSGSILTLRLT